MSCCHCFRSEAPDGTTAVPIMSQTSRGREEESKHRLTGLLEVVTRLHELK